MKLRIKLNTIEDVKKFCDKTNELSCDIYAKQSRYVVNAKSVMGVFSLNLLEGFTVEIEDINEEIQAFIQDIAELGFVVEE